MKQAIFFQRLEGLTLFAVSLLVYMDLDMSILLFVLTLLLVDIFMLGYLINTAVGTYAYNLGHSIVAPLIVGCVGYFTDTRMAIAISLIWLAHIGLDRAFGYGLKFKTGFKDTHLGHL